MGILKHSEITGQLIKAFFNVHNTLGCGFLEKIYENAIALEARKLGLQIRQQMPIRVMYRGAIVGEYFADLIANEIVIVELKAVRQLAREHEAQLLNYLKATEYEIGLLLNFGLKPEFRRRVMDNSRKGSLSWHSRD